MAKQLIAYGLNTFQAVVIWLDELISIFEGEF
jgi:hypothetical protein